MTDKRVLIDTSVWINYFRAIDDNLAITVEELISNHRACITPVIYAELIRGCLNHKELNIISKTVGLLPKIDLSGNFWEDVGFFAFDLARKGALIKLVDALIAKVCVENKSELYTLDKDFTLIAKHSSLKLYSD